MPLLEVLTLQDLARQKTWTPERTQALPGRVRGSLLKDWGVHVERRWGRSAPSALVAALGHDLPIRPSSRDWFPSWVQLRLTELIVAHHLGGDTEALAPLLWSDASQTAGPIATAALRLAGPVRVLRRAPGSFGGLYDQVRAETELQEGRIAVHFRGQGLVDQPTWQLLQAISLTGLAQLAGITDWALQAGVPGPGEFTMVLTLD